MPASAQNSVPTGSPGPSTLHKIGRQLHKRYKAARSYQWADTDAYRDRTERLERKALSVAAEAQLKVSFQQDPRGWPVIITFEQNDLRLGGG